jgi:hypothetical protein
VTVAQPTDYSIRRRHDAQDVLSSITFRVADDGMTVNIVTGSGATFCDTRFFATPDQRMELALYLAELTAKDGQP